MPSYGPQVRRKGNVKFVRAKLGVTKDDDGDAKGKARELLAGDEKDAPARRDPAPFRSLYDGMDALPLQSLANSFVKAAPPRPPPGTIDVDLTLDSSDASSSDDELTVSTPTGIVLPPPRRSPPRPLRRTRALPIHRLLADFSPNEPLVPPIQYGIGSNNIGWKLLQRQGWREGEGLGVVPVAGPGKPIVAPSIKVPIKASEKADRKGLGMAVEASKDGGRTKRNFGKEPVKKKGKRERLREREKAELDLLTRGKGARGMAKDRLRDDRERKAMLGYMNR